MKIQITTFLIILQKRVQLFPFVLIFAFFIYFPPFCYAQEVNKQNNLTAIIGAVDKEVVLLQKNMTEKAIQKIQGLTFITGKLHGRSVVLAKTGVGKVNASMTVTLLIAFFKPSEILFTGIAGAINPKLKLGDIVIASQTLQYDFGTLMPDGIHNWGMNNPINDKPNPVFYTADTLLLQSADVAIAKIKLTKIKVGKVLKLPTIIHGIVVTGDMFIASSAKNKELREKYKADAVEMEGAAVAQVCWQNNIPCLVIRSLSDAADENAKSHYDYFIDIAARNSATLVMALVENLEKKKK
jgi:adenosylhomocysteine nucleosidase